MRVSEAAFETRRLSGTLLVAAPDALAAAERALEDHGSLFRWAAAHPEARRLEGRGAAFSVPAPGGRWVVRHYRRGGAVAAPLLGDRYVRATRPRPLAELEASRALLERGVDTPEVRAVAIYPSGAFYRGDVATRWIADAVDLAGALFGPEALTDADGRLDACAAAGRLLRILHDRGVLHRDLNLKNILLEWTPRGPRPWVIDLDGCRIVDGLGPRRRAAMLERFERSLRKWEGRSGRVLAERERDAIRAAYGSHGG